MLTEQHENANGENRGSRNNGALPPFDDPKYRSELADLDLTEEQATEFLRALDFILRTFVDLGWGVDSVQNFIPAMREFSMDSGKNELEQKENKDAFNNAALRKDE